jgi:hypothetical protein
VSVLPPDQRHPEPPERQRLLRGLAIGVGATFVLGVGLTFWGGGGDDASGGRPVAAPTARQTTPPPTRRPTVRPSPRPTPTPAPSPTREPQWDGREADFGFLREIVSRAPEGMRMQLDRAEVRNGRVVNRSSRVREVLLAPRVTVTGRRELAGSPEPRPVTLAAFLAALARDDSVPLVLRYDSYGRVVRVEEY